MQKQGNTRISSLVLHIKEILSESSDHEKTIRKIQNQIDGKQNQIRQIFSRNIESVINHYLKYYDITNHQKRLDFQCQQFQKKVEKGQKLSQYDQTLIERDQINLKNMSEVKDKLEKYRDYIRLLKKITMNINEDKYNNAIKLYNQGLDSQINSKDTPLKNCPSVLKAKIQQHLVRLLNLFWDENRSKQKEIGEKCFSKIFTSNKQKINIYQNFFGKQNSRVSSLVRNTQLIRNSLIRKSTLDNNVQQSGLSFLKNMSEDSQVLNRFIIRANVQMAPLKQVKFLSNQLDKQSNGKQFQELLKKHIFLGLKKIQQNNPCQNAQDYKKLLQLLIGFVLVFREVVCQLNIELDQKLFIGQVYNVLRSQIKSIVTVKKNFKSIKNLKQLQSDEDNSKIILKLKQYSDIFTKVLEVLKISKNIRDYTLLLEDLLQIFCALSLDIYENLINQEINNDNLITYKIQNQQEQKSLKQTLSLQMEQIKNKGLNFTGFVPFIITIFDQFYESMLILVKQSNVNKSSLHDHLAEVLQRIVSLYGSQLIIKDQTLQIAQGEINLFYSEKIYKYYSSKLQSQYNISRTTEPAYQQKFSQLIIQLRRRMRQLMELKVEMMLSSYYSQPVSAFRKSHSDFIQWLLQFIKQTILYMKQLRSGFVQQLLYSTFTYIVFFYWEYLKQIKQYNLITIHNLQVDLVFIYKYISKWFSIYPNIGEKLKSLQQFYSLLLTNNVNDICDPQKREISYNGLDLQNLIQILPKYNRINVNGLRDLKKKDVEQVVKKLQAQIK